MINKSRTWILLRGLAREKGHWGPFVSQFQSAFPGDEILPIDFPGVGEFKDEVSPRTMDGIFKFVRARAVERTKAQTQFYLVAVSLGGMVAMEWLRSRPEDLGGAVLINTSVSSLSPFYYRLRWQVWGKFAGLLATTSPRDREKALTEILINSVTAREKALPIWNRLANERPIKASTFLHQLLAAAQFKNIPFDTKVPVLLLSGLGDRLVDPSCSFLLHDKTRWPMEKHPWGGHDLTWDDPDWILNHIKTWSKAAPIETGKTLDER